MLLVRAHKFWLRPNREQESILEEWQEASRILWNRLLWEQKRWRWLRYRSKCWPWVSAANPKPRFDYGGMTKIGTALRKETPEIAAFASHGVNGTCHALATSWKVFFDFRRTPTKYPHLLAAKNRRLEGGKQVRNFASPRFKDPGEPGPLFIRCKSKIRENQVWIEKLGWVRCKTDYPLVCAVKNVIIRKTPKRWMVTVQTEEELPEPIHLHPEDGVGMGVTDNIAWSDGVDGKTFAIPEDVLRETEKLERRRLRLQRGLSRKREAAKKEKRRVGTNYWKQSDQYRRVTERIANIRNNWLHKISHDLVATYALIGLEDLNVAGMMAAAKGSSEATGKNDRAKAGLNRSILDRSWSELRRQLTYKSEWQGGEVVPVDPGYTSRTCNKCGHVAKENRHGKRFKCVECGHTDDADLNAAKNILAVAQTVSARGDIGRGSGQARELASTHELRTSNANPKHTRRKTTKKQASTTTKKGDSQKPPG